MGQDAEEGADREVRDVGEEPKPDRLASKPSAGVLIGGMLAGVEQIVTGRPRPPAQIEEPYRDEWASIEGVTVEGLDERPKRADPPDRSGARL